MNVPALGFGLLPFLTSPFSSLLSTGSHKTRLSCMGFRGFASTLSPAPRRLNSGSSRCDKGEHTCAEGYLGPLSFPARLVQYSLYWSTEPMENFNPASRVEPKP